MTGARFVADARREFLSEIDFYAAAQPGLGQRFASAVEQSVALAVAFPAAGMPAAAGTRRVMVRGFPFSIVYRPTGSGIVVIAVAHHARRPGYWASRAAR